MKTYVINFKSLLKYFSLLLLSALLISAVNITGMDVLGVFSSGKELPIYCVETPDKKAAITFDCAWGADDILQILDTLKQKQVKASFFIVGQWAEKHPEEVRMIAQEGHDIGNHSYSHLRMGALDRDRIVSEIQKCGKLLDELTGEKTELFRAPYGDYSNNTVTVARDLGYYTIQWNVDSLDWKPGIGIEEIKSRVSSKLNPGSIILFHNDTPHTAAILPDIIDTIKTSGYELVPVSQIIIRENYFIDFDGRQKKKE